MGPAPRRTYSTDASNYRQVPISVLTPCGAESPRPEDRTDLTSRGSGRSTAVAVAVSVSHVLAGWSAVRAFVA